MTTKPNDDYGLLIEPVNRHGTDYVHVRVVRREPDGEVPLGCSSDDDYNRPRHLIGLYLDGLGMSGFVTEGKDPAFIAHDVEYRDVFSIDATKLKRMTKALARVNARIEKDAAREPGDKLMSFAAALKLSFAVVRTGKPGVNPGWLFLSVTDGRNRYRAMIDELVATAVARTAA